MPRAAATRTLGSVTSSTSRDRAHGGSARGLVLALVLAPVGVGGCFTGSDASGLPCEKDLDCGLRQRCEAGFCGGPPGSENGSSTTDPVTTSESSSTGIPADCGNGIVEDDESCEPPEPFENGAECDRDCTIPLCGDGVFNPVAVNTEECDPSIEDNAVETATCDADCTLALCGDNRENLLAEPCDDSNSDDFDGCTSQCFRPFLADPMTSMTRNWTVETPTYEADLPRGGTIGPYSLPEDSSPTIPARSEPTGWRHLTNRWESGATPYFGFPDGLEGAPGTTRLVSREIELSLDLDGDRETEDDAALLDEVRYELHFHHEYAFDGCTGIFGDGDGGIIRIHDVEADTVLAVAPVGGYVDTIRDGSDCLEGQVEPRAPNPIVLDAPPTPYGAVPAFTGTRAAGGRNDSSSDACPAGFSPSFAAVPSKLVTTRPCASRMSMVTFSAAFFR